MKIGFTGTREGMTEAQKANLAHLLAKHGCSEFHHGDCIGADAESHEIAAEQNCQIVIHPPGDNKLRAYKSSDRILPVKSYFDRNIDIVDETEFLIAASESESVFKSGTWWTIRYAKRAGKTVLIMFPDGKVRTDKPKS